MRLFNHATKRISISNFGNNVRKCKNTFSEQTPENIEIIKHFISIAFNAINGGRKAGAGNVKFAYCAMGTGGGSPQYCTSSVERLHKYYAKQQIEHKFNPIPLKSFKSQIKSLMESIKGGGFCEIYQLRNNKSLNTYIDGCSDLDYHFLIFKLA